MIQLSEADARIVLRLATKYLLGYRVWEGLEYSPVLEKIGTQLGMEKWTEILSQADLDKMHEDGLHPPYPIVKGGAIKEEKPAKKREEKEEKPPQGSLSKFFH